jgi:hypothetical protein
VPASSHSLLLMQLKTGYTADSKLQQVRPTINRLFKPCEGVVQYQQHYSAS